MSEMSTVTYKKVENSLLDQKEHFNGWTDNIEKRSNTKMSEMLTGKNQKLIIVLPF